MPSRNRRPLPPVNRVPRELLGLTLIGYTVGSWCPTQDGSGPPEAVALGLVVDGFPGELVMRLKSPRAVDELIAALQRHKADVWPDAAHSPNGDTE